MNTQSLFTLRAVISNEKNGLRQFLTTNETLPLGKLSPLTKVFVLHGENSCSIENIKQSGCDFSQRVFVDLSTLPNEPNERQLQEIAQLLAPYSSLVFTAKACDFETEMMLGNIGFWLYEETLLDDGRHLLLVAKNT